MAELDVISAAEAREGINLPRADQTDTTRIQRLVSAVSARMDQMDVCGPIVKRDVTESHNGGRATLLPRKRPVASVTSVTEYHATTPIVLDESTNASEGSTGYSLEPVSNRIVRRAGNLSYYFWWGTNNIVVEYVAGRFDATADVDPIFKEAAKMFFAHLWRAEHGAGNNVYGIGEAGVYSYGPTFSVPKRVLDLLGEEAGMIPGFA